MDEADYDNYKNNQIEQHAKIWIEAYRQTK